LVWLCSDYEAASSSVDFAENLVELLVDIAGIQKGIEYRSS
jgi:predicted ATP-grasp superfamily ATP-dependent carboligase